MKWFIFTKNNKKHFTLSSTENYLNQDKKNILNLRKFEKIWFDGDYYSYYFTVPNIGYAEDSIILSSVGGRDRLLAAAFGSGAVGISDAVQTDKYGVIEKALHPREFYKKKLSFLFDLENYKSSVIADNDAKVLFVR
jgi:hypothetical protein